MTRRAVDLAGGFDRLIRPGNRVLIKPNLTHATVNGTGTTTDIRVIRAVARLVHEAAGCSVEIIIGEGSPWPWTTRWSTPIASARLPGRNCGTWPIPQESALPGARLARRATSGESRRDSSPLAGWWTRRGSATPANPWDSQYRPYDESQSDSSSQPGWMKRRMVMR